MKGKISRASNFSRIRLSYQFLKTIRRRWRLQSDLANIAHLENALYVLYTTPDCTPNGCPTSTPATARVNQLLFFAILLIVFCLPQNPQNPTKSIFKIILK